MRARDRCCHCPLFSWKWTTEVRVWTTLLFVSALGVGVCEPESRAAAATSKLAPTPQQPKYIRWWREWQHCAGLLHQRASFACMLTEAKYLNRTAIIQNDYCMHSGHTLTRNSQELDSVGRIYNMPEIEKEVRVLLRNGVESVETLVQQDLIHLGASSSLTQTKVPSTTSTATLADDPATIVTRTFTDDYWYTLCSRSLKGNPELADTAVHNEVYAKVNLIPDRLVAMARLIADHIGGPFSYIHVRRGDKVRDTARWPHLDRDTRGEAILASNVVLNRVPLTNAMYIATDEKDPSVFSAIFQHRRGFMLSNFSRIVPSLATLGAYELNLVDFHLRTFADPKRVETFYHLTCDEKHGLGMPRTCECGPLRTVICPRGGKKQRPRGGKKRRRPV
eukprot:m.245382 g.245382  ORF g.245382 m.245382 type:complete len:392 (-) comp26402_c0_seq4:1770-2945(-)